MRQPDELAQNRQERMTTMQLVGPERAEDQETLVPQLGCDEPQQVQARGIRPVEILDQDEQGPIVCGPPEELEHGIEQREALVRSRWSALERWLRFDLGDETGQCLAAPPYRLHRAIRMLSEKEYAQDLDERRKGRARGLRLEAATANHRCSARSRHSCKLGGKARLADSGLASQEHETSLTLLGRIQAGLQLGTLDHPADEYRARDASNHRADHGPSRPAVQGHSGRHRIPRPARRFGAGPVHLAEPQTYGAARRGAGNARGRRPRTPSEYLASVGVDVYRTY